MKRMLDSMDFRKAESQWDLPEPGSNRGCAPVQLIEQLLVSICCGACRFTHFEVNRLDYTDPADWLDPESYQRSLRLVLRGIAVILVLQVGWHYAGQIFP
jgi:hypothetical protein